MKQMVNIRGGLDAILAQYSLCPKYTAELILDNLVQLIPIDFNDVTEQPQQRHSSSLYENLDVQKLGSTEPLEAEHPFLHHTTFESYSSAQEAVVALSHFYSVL